MSRPRWRYLGCVACAAVLAGLLASAIAPVPAFAEDATPTADGVVTVVAVGDLLFDTQPRRLISAKGGEAPLKYVAPILRDADLTIGNLENPLSNRGKPVSGKPAHLIFNGHPKAVKGLTASGFDFVALANNHTMDHGRIALKDTLRTLDGAGIAHSGAGMNKRSAWAPAIIERDGKRIAYLSFSQNVPGGFTPSSRRAGVAIGRSRREVRAAIRSAKKQADYVIVSFHWGVEQSYTPNSGQIRDGRAAIDAGADMVLSHHPHVVQGFEFYKGKLIAYSLGNFVFPYKTTEGRKSVILRASLTPDGVRDVSIVPVYLGQYGRPALAKRSMASNILGKVKKNSRRRGTRVTIRGRTAYLSPTR